MTPEQFCYWMQGYSEVSGSSPTEEQWKIIQDHLKVVFEKITPDRQLVGTDHIPYRLPSMFTSPVKPWETQIYC